MALQDHVQDKPVLETRRLILRPLHIASYKYI